MKCVIREVVYTDNEDEIRQEKEKQGWYFYGSDDKLLFDDCLECSNDWDQMSPYEANLANIGCKDIITCMCDCHKHCKVCGSQYEKIITTEELKFVCKTCNDEHVFYKA